MWQGQSGPDTEALNNKLKEAEAEAKRAQEEVEKMQMALKTHDEELSSKEKLIKELQE